jgi:hypothetical protein
MVFSWFYTVDCMGMGNVMQWHDTNCQFTLTFVLDRVAAFEMSDSNSLRWLCHYTTSSTDTGSLSIPLPLFGWIHELVHLL